MQLNARSMVLASALSLGIFAMTQPTTAHAQVIAPAIAADSTLLNVSANGKTTRVPDIANFSTGVVTRAAEANAAMRDNATQMDKVVKALSDAGIAKKDIQTSGVNLNPDYNYRENQPPEIKGYQASNTVNVKVRDLSKLGKIMDILIATGANQLNGPSFSIDDEEGALNEARQVALKEAQARAQMYAQSLGLKVRRIVSIDENSSRPSYPVHMMAMDARASAGKEATPIMPGESEVNVALNVQFELGR